MASRPDPDLRLATEQFAELNRTFYQSRPYSYLRQRLAGLMLVAAAAEEVADALRKPMKIGEATLTVGDVRPNDERAEDYASVEALVLFHHAAEALFRLYFAHSHGPRCPWLEVSRVELGGRFKTRIETFLDALDDPNVRSDLLKVFRGHDRYERAKEAGFSGPEAEWDERVDGLVSFLDLVGRRLLKEGNVYNAAKHGLGVHSAQIGIQLGESPTPILAVNGPSITVLRVNRDLGQWEKLTTWVHIDTTLALITLITREIESIFTIGRVRYVGERVKPRFPIHTTETIRRLQTGSELAQAARKPDGVVMLVDTMSETLAYYADAEDLGDVAAGEEG